MKTELDLKEELLINEARKKAAQQGANGVIIEKIEEPNTGTKVASALFGTAANKKAEFVSVFVKDTGCKN